MCLGVKTLEEEAAMRGEAGADALGRIGCIQGRAAGTRRMVKGEKRGAGMQRGLNLFGLRGC